MTAPPFKILDRRLRNVAGLTDAPAQALSALLFHERRLKAGDTLYPPGAVNPPCYILLQGAVTRFKMRSDGSRAVVAFELPGDIINLETLLLGHIDCGVTAAADSAVAVVDRRAMRQVWNLQPALEAALWRYAFVKAAALEEWLLNIGKRPPVGRVAHVLMEIQARLVSLRTPEVDSTLILATTRDIADAMGLQEVVVTRILHELASRGLISREDDAVRIRDTEGLSKIGEFRPDYLHLAS